MTQALAEFRDKFQVDDLTLAETDHWVLTLRPQQLTLGSMVLSTKANVLSFAELTEDQSRDMAKLLGVAEQRVKSVFGAVRINALCLMMQDPLLHFHLFPRYDQAVTFEGKQWQDADWPKPPQVKPTEEDKALNQALLNRLKD